MLAETKIFRVNDVYLAKYGADITKLTIYEICGNLIRHQYGWETIESFNERVLKKYGIRKKFLFFSYIIKQ